MANLHHVVTLGIGTPADIPHFVLVGLSPAGVTELPAAPASQTWTLRRRTTWTVTRDTLWTVPVRRTTQAVGRATTWFLTRRTTWKD